MNRFHQKAEPCASLAPAASNPIQSIRLLAACSLAAAGLLQPATAQIQTAGNLQVSLDALALPVGPVSYLNNGGLAGGVFQSVTNAGLGPQIIALGGTGTRGVMFDGEDFLVHLDAPGGSPCLPPPF
jgi:hypothetical protein